ncbi:hypothetical protein [Psychromonas sp. MME2]
MNFIVYPGEVTKRTCPEHQFIDKRWLIRLLLLDASQPSSL